MGIQRIIHDIKTIKIPADLIDQKELIRNGPNATVIHITKDGWESKRDNNNILTIYKSTQKGNGGISLTGKDYIVTKSSTEIIIV